MTSWPDNGGLFPEGQVEDRWDADDRRALFEVCKDFTPCRWPISRCLFCGFGRSEHFGRLVEAATDGEWTRYATLLEGRKR
jgi:hypothetical protein